MPAIIWIFSEKKKPNMFGLCQDLQQMYFTNSDWHSSKINKESFKYHYNQCSGKVLKIITGQEVNNQTANTNCTFTMKVSHTLWRWQLHRHQTENIRDLNYWELSQNVRKVSLWKVIFFLRCITLNRHIGKIMELLAWGHCIGKVIQSSYRVMLIFPPFFKSHIYYNNSCTLK